jgi:hypothetical protein
MGPEYAMKDSVIVNSGSAGVFIASLCDCCGQPLADSPFERVCQACQWCPLPERRDGA